MCALTLDLGSIRTKQVPHPSTLTFHGVFIGVLSVFYVKDLSHLLNNLSTQMGGQSMSRRWWCIEADLPTVLGDKEGLLVMSLRTNNLPKEDAGQESPDNSISTMC